MARPLPTGAQFNRRPPSSPALSLRGASLQCTALSRMRSGCQGEPRRPAVDLLDQPLTLPSARLSGASTGAFRLALPAVSGASSSLPIQEAPTRPLPGTRLIRSAPALQRQPSTGRGPALSDSIPASLPSPSTETKGTGPALARKVYPASQGWRVAVSMAQSC